MAMTDDKQKAQILVAGCGKLGGDIATVLLGGLGIILFFEVRAVSD